MRKSLVLFVCVFSVSGFNFNTKDVREIHVKNNSYFGYSLLLQKGLQPAVIVGAPRQNSGHSGGALYYCTLEGSCSSYAIPKSNKKTPPDTPNGNYLGASLDGGENTGEQLVACAPRIVNVNTDNYFLNGWCFVQENSTSYTSISKAIINPLQKQAAISRPSLTSSYYYDHAFGEVGLDIHYLKEAKEVLLGAPGIKNWNGAIVVQSLSKLTDYRIIPKRSAPVVNENYGYLGYKVTSAKFEAARGNISYIAGAPRAGQLFGHVKIFNSLGTLLMTLTGNEIGSYFGSSILASDLNNDHKDDLFVGAPMGAGSTWDEGYVYFYKCTNSRPKFENAVKLVGSKKVGARFGTSIVSLGDVDLDSYNDIAISAPYEDDGVGAVYIYRGSKTGINVLYSQRLSPLKFSSNFGTVRGFGQGLSGGVDIDGNGHNDLAVGAYKSDQVFIVPTTSIIDYELSLDSNLTSISTSVMNIQFCVYYTQRSKTNDLRNVKFKVELLLDYRVDGQTRVAEVLNVVLSKNYCKSLDVKVQQSPLDISPFKMSLKAEIQQENLIGVGESVIEKMIPYSHGCGDDNICQTKILVEALTSQTNIVLGADTEIDVNVSTENVGEPGYGCNLYINFPNVVELRDTRDCVLENSTYKCPFAARLISNKEMYFKFDTKLRKPTMDQVVISFEVKCLGENSGETKSEVSLNVLLKNSPYVQGSSIPNNFYFNEENMKDVEISHLFRVGNFGPSPVKLDVFILVPTIKKDGFDIFDVEAKGSFNGIQVQCFPTNKTEDIERTYDVGSLLTEPLNKTLVIDCFDKDVECLRLYCDGDYLYKSTEIAEYNVKIIVRTNLLESNYHSHFLGKGLLAYISTAYLHSSDGARVEGHSSTLVFASSKKPVPIWVYIVATLVGILLLALLILLLYKCHFFDRNYRDKLNDEKLMEHKTDDDTETEVEENVAHMSCSM